MRAQEGRHQSVAIGGDSSERPPAQKSERGGPFVEFFTVLLITIISLISFIGGVAAGTLIQQKLDDSPCIGARCGDDRFLVLPDLDGASRRPRR